MPNKLTIPDVRPRSLFQSLKHLVIFRKISFGTRSESRLITHSVFPSLFETATSQGVDPRKFMQTLLTADTPTAQAALYNKPLP